MATFWQGVEKANPGGMIAKGMAAGIEKKAKLEEEEKEKQEIQEVVKELTKSKNPRLQKAGTMIGMTGDISKGLALAKFGEESPMKRCLINKRLFLFLVLTFFETASLNCQA